MSEFLGVSREFMPVFYSTIAITLFCYVLYMVCYRIGNYPMNHKLLRLLEYPREYVRLLAMVSLFMNVLSRLVKV